MVAIRRLVKSAVGATSVTLVPPSSPGVVSESKPGNVVISQIVVSTGGATPDAGFWGTTTTDGVQYAITIHRVS